MHLLLGPGGYVFVHNVDGCRGVGGVLRALLACGRNVYKHPPSCTTILFEKSDVCTLLEFVNVMVESTVSFCSHFWQDFAS